MVRENIYAAAFALFSGDPAWVTKNRLWKHWDEVPPDQQPAIFQTQVKEVSTTKDRTGIPLIWHFHINLHLYVNVGQQGDQGMAPSQVLNPLVDKILGLIQPGPGPTGEQTLGGLVTKCRVEGDIITDEGLFGPQGIVMIPVVILIPGNA